LNYISGIKPSRCLLAADLRERAASAEFACLRVAYAGPAPMPLLQVDDVLADWRARRQDP
jgi:hypothetical protein